MNNSRSTFLLIIIGILIMLFSRCKVTTGFASAEQLRKQGYSAPFKGTHYIRRTSDSTRVNVVKL